MRILLIKLKHIGDTLLLTPTIQGIRQSYPEAEIWVAVRKGTEDILAGCDAVDRVLTTAAPEKGNRKHLQWSDTWKLLKQIRSDRFDFVFELSDGDRGRILAQLSRSQIRATLLNQGKLNKLWRLTFNRLSSAQWRNGHSVEKDYSLVHEFLPLSKEIPTLQFTPTADEDFPNFDKPGDYLLFHPATRWRRKEWPIEYWETLGKRIIQEEQKSIVVSSGPASDEIEFSKELTKRLGEKASCTEGATSWRQLAGLIRNASCFIGVDTAAMHLAAACQCPTVALFGPSIVNLWKPWKTPNIVVTPELENAAQPKTVTEIGKQEMSKISPEQVWTAYQTLKDKTT
jgi:heptosyltransferase-3